MLKTLTVNDFAIVETAEAEFSSGLNVLTGETGAGKSILMGALELVLGGRADTSVVRDGAKESRVEAVFSLPKDSEVPALLAASDLPACEGGELIIRRTVGANSRIRINDATATMATLKKVGSALVDIHGPRANQNILEEKFQRLTLDRFGDVAGSKEMSEYSVIWRELEMLRGQLQEIEGDSGGEEELDILKYQVTELEEAAISEADEDIAERHAAAAHAGEIVGAANEITEMIGGDGGASTILAQLQSRFVTMSKHFPQAVSWAEETEQIERELDDLSREVAKSASKIDLDPGELESLDQRITILNRLKRKYSTPTIADLMEKRDSKKQRLENLEHRDERAAKIREKISAKENELDAAAKKVRALRKKAGEKLSKSITAELRDLGFREAKFSVEISDAEPNANGADKIDYAFMPNPGESARPLKDIASSGEIARVMLAIKEVLASHDSTDVLVFDEIDANIGAEIGLKVGDKMRKVADAHQVIAITHLPQSAVFADRHFVVSKSVSGGRTRTRIEKIDGDARVKEIARMLGGENSTSVVMKHAQELLKHGKKQTDV